MSKARLFIENKNQDVLPLYRRKRKLQEVEVTNKRMLECLVRHYEEKAGGYEKVRIYVTYHKVNYRWNGKELVHYDFIKQANIYKRNQL